MALPQTPCESDVLAGKMAKEGIGPRAVGELAVGQLVVKQPARAVVPAAGTLWRTLQLPGHLGVRMAPSVPARAE